MTNRKRKRFPEKTNEESKKLRETEEGKLAPIPPPIPPPLPPPSKKSIASLPTRKGAPSMVKNTKEDLMPELKQKIKKRREVRSDSDNYDAKYEKEDWGETDA